jgi:hypothetical protein
MTTDMAGAGRVDPLRRPDDEREVGWDYEATPEVEPADGWIDDDLARLLAEIPPHHLDH